MVTVNVILCYALIFFLLYLFSLPHFSSTYFTGKILSFLFNVQVTLHTLVTVSILSCLFFLTIFASVGYIQQKGNNNSSKDER